ncbi:MAG: hypothetical protein ACRDPT_05580 [Streptomycetales bacterium]
MKSYDDDTLKHLRQTIADHRRAAGESGKEAAKLRKLVRAHDQRAVRSHRLAAQLQRLLEQAEGQPVTSIEPDPVGERARLVAGFHEFADFIEENPQIPVSRNQTIHYFVSNSRGVADPIAEVNRVAELLGVQAGPIHGNGPHHVAVRSFGTAVEYEAIVCNAYDKAS